MSLRSPTTEGWILLTESAKSIWERLDYPMRVEELTASLAAEYDAPEQTIAEGVRAILPELIADGVIEEVPQSERHPLRNRYLALLKRALANTLYPELELQIRFLAAGGAEGLSRLELKRHLRDLAVRSPDEFAELMAGKRQGTAPLQHPHTMIGLFRLSNIERCAEQVIADGVPGDFLEAGVCKGGAAIFMRALQIAHGAAERRTWVVDSFQGVPPSERECDTRYGLHLDEQHVPWLACSEEGVRDHFSRYDMLDGNVLFLSGWLAETLPDAPIETLAILRIDVDLYSSTADCLDLLYDKVSPGGFVIVDDYGFHPCCGDAVDDFRLRRGIEEPIQWIDNSGIFWRKQPR